MSPTTPSCIVAGIALAPECKSDLISFFANTKVSDTCFIVTTHGAQSATVGLKDMLQGVTGLTVNYAEDGSPVAKGNVYIAPPDRFCVVERGSLRLFPKPIYAQARCYDVLLSSIANELKSFSVAILFAPIEFDGLTGVCGIKAANGFVLAKSHLPSIFNSGLAGDVEPYFFDFVGSSEEVAKQYEEAESVILARVSEPKKTIFKAITPRESSLSDLLSDCNKSHCQHRCACPCKVSDMALRVTHGVYDQISYPILVCTADLSTVYINRAACDFLDLEETENHGLNAEKLLRGARLPAAVDCLKKTFLEERSVILDVRTFDKCYEVSTNFNLTAMGEPLVTLTIIDETAHYLYEKHIAESELKLATILTQSPSAVFVCDLSGHCEFANERFETISGLSLNNLYNKTAADIFGEAAGNTFRSHQRHAATFKENIFSELSVEIDGKRLVMEMTTTHLATQEGVVYGTCTHLVDITAKRKGERQLQLAMTAFDNALEGFLVTDKNHTILLVNAAFTEITGYTPEQIIGKKPSVLSSGRYDEAFYENIWESIEHRGQWQGELINRHQSGREYHQRLSINAVRNEDGDVENYIGILSDVTAEKFAQEQIQFIALHDPLTSLPNRRLFQDRIEHELAVANREGSPISILFIDIDNFKVINDTLGHVSGDTFLAEVANRVKCCVREIDTVARIGGDEFAVLLSDTNESDAAVTASRISREVSTPFSVGSGVTTPSVSIGVCSFPAHGRTVSELVKNADIAMYKAKEKGKRGYQIFDDSMLAELSDRLSVESSLRIGIKNGDLHIEYQPQIDIKTGRVVGAEALVRWNRNGEMIRPDVFIPIAEKTDLIADLGEFVCRQVFAQIAQWDSQGLFVPRVSINISTEEICRCNIPQRFVGLSEEFNVHPNRIRIEITETALMRDPVHSEGILHTLGALGFSLSLDDFGTGYSSLAYLHRYALDEIKIDKCFIRNIATKNDDAAIARAIIALANSMNLQVVAEGLETAPQHETLNTLGCHVGQGFLFATPLKPAEFAFYLRNNESRHESANV